MAERVDGRAGFDALAGVIASAITERLGQTPDPATSGTSRNPRLSSYRESATANVAVQQPRDGAENSRNTAYRQAVRLNVDSQSSGRSKRRFPPPSIFGSARAKKKRSSEMKPTFYVRDIVLLPPECKTSQGNIAIPRGTRRNRLAQSGMVGKLQFSSDMTEYEIQVEICKVFATPMGLKQKDFEEDLLFPFTYLQRPGAGSRCLCTPSVSSSFEWNGRQVASLAKSGSYIYLLAGKSVPGWEQVSKLCTCTAGNSPWI